MNIRIEDNFEDILSKAQAGLKLTDKDVAEAAKLTVDQVTALKGGDFDNASARALARALQVDPDALVALAGGWRPEVSPPAGLHCFNTPFPVPGYAEMTVNTYLVIDPASGSALAFDTGADVSSMLETLNREKRTLSHIFITHAHTDHIKDLLTLKQRTSAPAFTPENEPVAGADPFQPGEVFKLGGLTIRTIETSGHSPGSVTYIIDGLDAPIAIVGDAIFAGSMGGAANAWNAARTMIREGILSLPENTVLCPGHGPLTTVAEERTHNPFFAGQPTA